MEEKNWRFSWTPQSVRWYEDADAYTGYNLCLAEKIRQYLKPTDRVFELAAGTGCLAAALAPFVGSYTANDMDEYALQALEQKKTGNMRIVPGDWRQVCREQGPFDVTIYQQFSGILMDWELLKSTTRRQVIAIQPLGKAVAPIGSGAEKAAFAIPADKKGHLESCAACTAFLDQESVSYRLTTMKIDFGQPFRSREEADAFFQHYYALTSGHSDPVTATAEEKLLPIEHPEFKYYYPKEKEIGILLASTAG